MLVSEECQPAYSTTARLLMQFVDGKRQPARVTSDSNLCCYLLNELPNPRRESCNVQNAAAQACVFTFRLYDKESATRATVHQ
jgi:hypothetical protein